MDETDRAEQPDPIDSSLYLPMPTTTLWSPAEYLAAMRASRVYDVAERTPLERAPRLSVRTGNDVWLKREDRQPVFSFKLRGAYQFMSGLSSAELAKGVVAASAGNHAQGVALAAERLGCRVAIVVPATTPEIKVEAVRSFGAEVFLFGDDFQSAYNEARRIESEQGRIFVEPYDHPEIIAGQGTVGLEILDQAAEPPHALFVPVGGGGLIAGIALAVKSRWPATRVIGVEPEDADAMHRSLIAGERIILDRVGLLADGVAVRKVGAEPFRIVREYVDEVVTVSNDAICAAVKAIYEDRRAILEPAGALAYAGLERFAMEMRWRGKSLVAIASGANVPFDRLGFIADRAAVGEGHEAMFSVRIPERPGAFKQLCAAFGGRMLTEFKYRMSDPDEAVVFAALRISGPEEVPAILVRLREAGFEVQDATGDETANTHGRFLVGGKCRHAVNERLLEFAFPERPGALAAFLENLDPRWNISLFHYRFDGSDRGKVLAGIQVPISTTEAFAAFLANLGYPYCERTEHRLLKAFVGSGPGLGGST